MNFIRSLFRNELLSTKLGRWRIQYEPQIIDLKTKQANEDHCGCCIDSASDKMFNTKMSSLMCIQKPNNSIMKIN
jgi:hypothetical protein